MLWTHNSSLFARLIAFKGVLLLLFLNLPLFSACSSPPEIPPCSDSLGCVNIPPGTPIRIMTFFVLSGEMGDQGLEQFKAVELALQDIDGKIFDHSIELLQEDDRCASEGGAVGGRRIAHDQTLVAVLGPSCSSAAVTAMPILSKAGLSVISGSNTAPSLTSMNATTGDNYYPGYYRTAWNDKNQGHAVAEFAFKNLGVRRAATLDDGDVYTRGISSVFISQFKKLGGEIVLTASVSKGDKEMRPVLDAIMSSKAQFLFMPLFKPEGGQILSQAREMGLTDLTFMNAESMLDNHFIKTFGDVGRGLYFVGPTPTETSEHTAFIHRFTERFGHEPNSPYTGPAYDAGRILFAALENSAEQLTDGSLRIGRQALRDAISSTHEHAGVTGKLSCDKFGDCGISRVSVFRLLDPNSGIKGLTLEASYEYEN